MKSFIPIILTVIGLTVASLNLRDDCHADNCLRAVAATRFGPGQVSTASADCSLFLQTTITPPATTVYTTTTTTLPPSSFNTHQKRQTARATIPTYASQCTDAAEYSSACSCFGVTPATTTAPTPTFTSTITVTVTATPTCTANLNTDPKNCGKCGNVCPPGSICENGSCSSTCQPQSCDLGFVNCGTNDNCFCFMGTIGTGFCGQNAICTLLDSCATDDDCGVGSGDICALHTCCPWTDPNKQGVCLSPQCENTAMKLMQMAKMKTSESGTAAFK